MFDKGIFIDHLTGFKKKRKDRGAPLHPEYKYKKFYILLFNLNNFPKKGGKDEGGGRGPHPNKKIQKNSFHILIKFK